MSNETIAINGIEYICKGASLDSSIKIGTTNGLGELISGPLSATATATAAAAIRRIKQLKTRTK